MKKKIEEVVKGTAKVFKHPETEATVICDNPNLYILYERNGFIEVTAEKTE